MTHTPRLLSAFDVLNIRHEQIPLLVLSDNMRSRVGFIIKRHTDGYYNHVMWMHQPGKFASQNWRYESVDAIKYLDGHHRLKFWWNPNWLIGQRILLDEAIREGLERRGRYDWWGIVGQMFRRLRWNFTRRDYCSEEAGRKLRLVQPLFDLKYPSPADINRWCKESPDMEVYGIYDPDLLKIDTNRNVLTQKFA